MTDVVEDPAKTEAKKREEFEKTVTIAGITNPDKVRDLLQVADLAKNWPELRPIHDHAMAELRVAKKASEVELDKHAKAKKDFEDKLVAERVAKAKAEADAEKKRQEEAEKRKHEPVVAPRVFPTPPDHPDPPPAFRPSVATPAPTTVRGSFVGTEDIK
jgi:hypothetical protein